MAVDADRPPAAAAVLFCTECGHELPGPGEVCPECGPTMDALRASIVAKYANQVAELRAVDALENAKKLRDEAGQKRALVAPVKARQQGLAEAVDLALAAKHSAEGRIDEAEQNLASAQKAAERARDSDVSARKRTKRMTAVHMAHQVLNERRAALTGAAAGHERAKRDRDHNKAQIEVLEAAALEAERAAEHPPHQVPPTLWTALLANPAHLLQQPDLGQEGRMYVAEQIATLARQCGVADEFRAEGRAQLEAEQTDKTRHPAFVQPLGNGNVGVIPNPLHPSTPQQFHGPEVRP